MRRTAFTLMELLIVVSIILLLMGMLFVGLRIAGEQAKKVKTQSALASIQADLVNYKQMNGKFPDKFPETGATNDWDAIFLGKKFDEIAKPQWETINRNLMSLLKSSGAPVSDLQKDGWGKPLHYRPAKFYPYVAAATAIDSDDPPGRDSYQLWSTGPDGADANKPQPDQGGAKSGDDITTWEKQP